ncbi:MAG: hypothetical protein Q7T60_11735, partial [Sphingopyxis sp.]|nr:hypothetical protein [Sphingopyxis sp.]
MRTVSKSRLLTTSAIVGLAVVHLSSPAAAQASFGIHNDQTGTLDVAVAENEEVVGTIIGVYADNGAVVVDNDGTIRGNGTDFGSISQRPSGGVVIAQPGSTVTNRGTITGAANGVTTSYFFGEDEEGEDLPSQALAADTTVTNSGLIRGQAGSGVALIGGGDVVNSGTIQGFGAAGVQATGVVIAEFPEAIAEGVTGVGSITNTQTGLIEGQLFGVLMSGGGTIDNEGTIRSTGTFNPATPNVSPFGVILTANANQPDRTATVNNSGTINGFLGLLANQSLDAAVINNSGLISAQQTAIIGLNSGDLIVNNAEDGRILGNAAAIASNAGTLTVDNEGLIRSNNQMGINITTPGAVIENSGTIQGNTFGITTNPFQVSPGVLVERAFNTSVTNSGTIIGVTNDAVRLVGGGTVTNSGFIHGVTPTQNGTDGVSIFAAIGQDLAAFSATVVNLLGGEIDGQRAGVVLSSGGTIDNAGDISASQFGVLIQNGLGEGDRTGTISNTGYIAGNAGEGIVGFGRLTDFSVTNSGEIIGGASDGIYVSTISGGAIVIENAEGGTITGAASGIETELGSLTLINAGTIRGNGANAAAGLSPDAGVTIADGGSSVTNSGTISGNRSGITTALYINQDTSEPEARAIGTTVANSGLIEGAGGAGVSLVGGGSVVNSGTIRGLGGSNANGTGVSLTEFSQSIAAGVTGIGSVENSEGGLIEGQFFGVAIQGGGTIENAGTIRSLGNPNPANPNVSPFGVILNAVAGQTGRIGTLNNSGSVSGFLGLLVGGMLDTGIINNDGLISGQALGVVGQSTGALVVNNGEDGQISASGNAITSNEGSLTVDNDGLVRSVTQNGINITTANATIVNAGTIEGGQYGIVTQVYQGTIGRAVGTDITNSGTIRGVNNDGIRLAGGGSVTNSGLIEGVNTGAQGTDGISMFAHADQPKEAFGASVVNLAGSNITGQRFGIILSGGGAVENAGNVSGLDGGMFLQGTAINTEPGEDRSGLTAAVINSGTISGSREGLNGYGVGFGSDLSSARLENSGTISSLHAAGVFHGTLGDVTITNTAAGKIEGTAYGIYADGDGKLSVVNAGTITSAATGIESTTQTSITNRGAIIGGNGVAVLLGAFDDFVTLGTGSAVTGLIDAGDGTDSVVLDGDIPELTAAQQLTAANGFEALEVAAGYWSTSGEVGAFDSVTIAEGGTLRV